MSEITPFTFSYFLMNPKMYEGYQVFYPNNLYPDRDVVEYCNEIKKYLMNNKYLLYEIRQGKIPEKKLIEYLKDNVPTRNIINEIIIRFSDNTDPENEKNKREALKAFEEKKNIILNHIIKQYRFYVEKFT